MNYSITPNFTRNYNQSFGTLTYKEDNCGFKKSNIPMQIKNGMPDKLDTSKSAKKQWTELNEIMGKLQAHEIVCELDTTEGASRLIAIVDGDIENPVRQKSKLLRNSIVEFFKDILKEADKRKAMKDSVQSETIEMIEDIFNPESKTHEDENIVIIDLDQDSILK
jgi:hypothetical protein